VTNTGDHARSLHIEEKLPGNQIGFWEISAKSKNVEEKARCGLDRSVLGRSRPAEKRDGRFGPGPEKTH